MIRECNIRNYTIYLRQLDDGSFYLFSHFEYHGADFDADMAKMAADPTTQKWWTCCKPCQEPLPRPRRRRVVGRHGRSLPRELRGSLKSLAHRSRLSALRRRLSLILDRHLLLLCRPRLHYPGNDVPLRISENVFEKVLRNWKKAGICTRRWKLGGFFSKEAVAWTPITRPI